MTATLGPTGVDAQPASATPNATYNAVLLKFIITLPAIIEQSERTSVIS
ncbi:MAG: hypothetical protein ACYCTW_04040 [Sulfuricella sp.]